MDGFQLIIDNYNSSLKNNKKMNNTFSNIITPNQEKVIELSGGIYEGFEIYDPNLPLDESINEKTDKFRDYFDLPF